MEYAHLGRTGLTVSRLGLGALKAAALENLPGSHGLMDRALEHGINYLDTSNIYGLQDGDDWSENVIGRWFAQGGRRRERSVLATKLYQAQDDWPNHGRLSALTAAAWAVFRGRTINAMTTTSASASMAVPSVSETAWVPKTASTSCDQAIFVDQVAGASLSSDAVPLRIDRLG